MTEPISYKSAGVDIDAQTEALRRIKKRVIRTHTPAVLTGLGSFGSLFDLTAIVAEYKEPVLVQSVDGVGTKLMVATLMGKHTTVGRDIVNHCCNDILCQGAKPLTFLDYIAVSHLSPDQVESIVAGMAAACVETGVSLVGGEMAELPGVYVDGEYDLAGLVTGVVEKSKILDGKNIVAGDVILGLPSTGLHTNGFTLARKTFLDRLGMEIDDTPEWLDGETTIGDALLVPHRDYSRLLWPLLQVHPVKGLAHITGGGLIDNVPRILPDTVDAVFHKDRWVVPPLFVELMKGSGSPESEMFRATNMGIGMVIVIGADAAPALTAALEEKGETVYQLGEIVEGKGVSQIV